MSEAAVGGESWRIILGIRFFAGTAAAAVRLGMRGGLVVVPSAPVLINMVEDAVTCEALLRSELAITDSGLMVLLWNLLKRDHVPRVSGLEYLKLLLDEPETRKPGSVFWVMPTEETLCWNFAWLQRRGYPVTREDCYAAPRYAAKGAITDEVLLKIITERKPPQVIIAIGGGVQERLGYFLQEGAAYRPAIHCIGAAIGFLSGNQVRIPMWADRWKLGWLFRCLSSPRQFIPRYWKAGRLIPLLWKYRERLPHSERSAAKSKDQLP